MIGPRTVVEVDIEAERAKAQSAPMRIPVMPSRNHDLVVDGMDAPGVVALTLTRELKRRKVCRDARSECG